MLLPEDPERPGFDALGAAIGAATHFINSALAAADHPLKPAEIGQHARSLSQVAGIPTDFNAGHPSNHLQTLRRRDGYAEQVGRGKWQLTPKARSRIAKCDARFPGQSGHTKRERSQNDTLLIDIKSILSSTSQNPTTKEALINARVGQGKFRSEVLNLWNERCSVSGCRTTEVIRASHIKPWCDSTDEERLDPRNGLALAATWDALFDTGLIAFDDFGTVLISEQLPSSERRIFDVVGKRLASPPHPVTAAYLAYHRKHVFR